MQKNYRLLNAGHLTIAGDEYWSDARSCWRPVLGSVVVGREMPLPVRREIVLVEYAHVLLPVGSITALGDELATDGGLWKEVFPNEKVTDGYIVRRAVSSGEVSDGYHTFNELYRHRCLLFCMALIGAAESFKSSKHSDGSEWEGWFIAGAKLPGGWITYHLPNSMWLLCPAPEVSAAPEWDGHTPNDVCDRMEQFLSLPISESENLPK